MKPLFIHLWLELKNKNFIKIGLNGFIVSQSDEQFENIKLNLMKFLN